MARLARLFEQLGETDRPYVASQASAAFAGVEVDHDVLVLILSLLDAATLSSLGSVCQSLQSLCEQTYPGLKLVLFAHQRVSLGWMRKRECDQCGGILADEPGCGKTITVLALLCKTSGLWTRPLAHAPTAMDAKDSEWTLLTVPYRREVVYKILKAVSRTSPREYEMFALCARAFRELPGYAEVVAHPMDFATLSRDETLSACVYSWIQTHSGPSHPELMRARSRGLH